jgi:hypothetical protein
MKSLRSTDQYGWFFCDSCRFELVGEAEFDDFAWLDFVDESAGDDVALARADR